MDNRPPSYNPAFPAPHNVPGKPNVPGPIYPNLGPAAVPMPMPMPVPSVGSHPSYPLPQSNATVIPLPPGYPTGTHSHGHTSGWRSGVFSEQNVMHKLEHDHKKVYLARNPNSDSGRIEWRFESSGYKIKSIKVEFKSKTFHNGQVRAYVITDSNQRLDLNSDKQQKLKDAHNARKFSIVAELSGGSGSEAWQHAQLFRQDCDEKSCPFEVVVKLDK